MSAAPSLHRIDEEFAIQDIQSVGFVLQEKLELLRNPSDDYTRDIWDDAVSGRTDRFVLLFEKPLSSQTPNITLEGTPSN